MFPGEFIKRINTQKYIDQELLLKSLTEPSPVSIRINEGKWKLKPAFSNPVLWCKSGYYLQSRPSFTLDPLFHSGCYFPREASGMILDQVFRQLIAPSENLHVLDLCAAPGGKSTQISDLIGEKSLLIANEVIKSRASVLVENITRWGKGNTLVTQNDPAAFSRLRGCFDIIFVDAPCSGEGMFRDRVAVDEWSEANARLCEERQRRIISDIWPALKEQGLLVYSTCTFNPGENEQNIRWLTANKMAECLSLDLSAFTGIEEIDYEGVKGYGFYPGKIRGEGFFLSAVRKESHEDTFREKINLKSEFTPDKTERAIAQKWVPGKEKKLLKRGEDLIMLACLPEEFMFYFRNLNIISPGTLVATRKKDDFLPSHQLALSQELNKVAFPSTTVNYRTALEYLRRDNTLIHNLQDGWNILTFEGVNLGFVKNLGNRINNYFPTGWRIRMNIPPAGAENIIRWSDEPE